MIYCLKSRNGIEDDKFVSPLRIALNYSILFIGGLAYLLTGLKIFQDISAWKNDVKN